MTKGQPLGCPFCCFNYPSTEARNFVKYGRKRAGQNRFLLIWIRPRGCPFQFQSIRPRLVIKYPYSLTPWDKFFKYKIFAELFAAYEFHGVVAADGAEDAVFDIGPQRGDERAEVCGGGVEYLVAQPGDILGGRAPEIAAAA